MNLRLSVIILCLLFLASCNSTQTGSTTNAPANSAANSGANSSTSPAANTAAAVKSKVDPCSLLTSDEIKAVQGEAFANAMRSDRQDGDFIVGQCYYALPTSVNSVVVNVTTARDTAGAPNPRDFWEGTFGKEAGEAEEGDRDKKERADREKKERAEKAKAGERRAEEEGEEAAKPEKVNGLGDEAFWIGSRVGGALYVLKKDLYFRISVGGAGDEKAKLNKSRTLAQNVLKRL
ncbi:MAG TPA: DUF3558 family protein [Pyrinomonadaceae bacterium]|nr:DUF3558 family protein [Pyrinomonadaceae bacterium]